ncbi:hypothetical protein ACOMHN_054719 [Nucella lapillus]
MLTDVNEDEERELQSGGHVPVFPEWEPSFCVLLQDMGKFTFYGSEQIAAERSCPIRRRKLRLDGGKTEFDRRWGYDPGPGQTDKGGDADTPRVLQPGVVVERRVEPPSCLGVLGRIAENPAPDESSECMSDPCSASVGTPSDTESAASAESFFKTRTYQDRNENVPDISLVATCH